VDRPADELAALRAAGDQVQVLRVTGFVFFGSANNLLERVRRRLQAGPLRFLVMDLRRVTGLDSSAAAAIRQVAYAAQAHGFELVVAGASERVRDRLALAGVVADEGVVRFEPDLDRGLQRCEDALLAEAGPTDSHGGAAPATGRAPTDARGAPPPPPAAPAAREPYLRR